MWALVPGQEPSTVYDIFLLRWPQIVTSGDQSQPDLSLLVVSPPTVFVPWLWTFICNIHLLEIKSC